MTTIVVLTVSLLAVLLIVALVREVRLRRAIQTLLAKLLTRRSTMNADRPRPADPLHPDRRHGL